MKILDRKDNIQIVKEYDVIIAWGLGKLFEKNYDPVFFAVEAVIDGRYEHVGETIKGSIPIAAPEILKDYSGMKVLVVSYSIYEKQILDKITRELMVDVDYVIYSLIDIINSDGIPIPHYYAKNIEDVAVITLLQELGVNRDVKLLEIGVCHPVIRNNTYLMYSIFHNNMGYKGVLVEANPTCWDIIEEYRGSDILVKNGICVSEDQTELEFYAFPDLMGHSTFDKDLAVRTYEETGFAYCKLTVSTVTTKTILEKYFAKDLPPDVLALDAEGMDYSILRTIDFKVWRIKIIVIEIMLEYADEIGEYLGENGYTMKFKTEENEIWSL